MPGLFITGTDTNVGKTVFTAALAATGLKQGRSVCVYKPIQTGSVDIEHPEDLGHIRALLGEAFSDTNPLTTTNSYNFTPPVAPYVADAGHSISLETITTCYQTHIQSHDWVLVEGAGGVRVPIAAGLIETRDLILALRIPAVVIARPDLGTINHTLLTVESLMHYRIPLHGVVISGYPEETDDLAVQTVQDVLQEWLPVPLLGVLPEIPLTPEGLHTLSLDALLEPLGLSALSV